MATTIPELIAEARGNPDWRERRLAVVGLGYQKGDEIYPVLRECLRDPVEGVQHAAIIAMGRRGDRQVVPELLRPKIIAAGDSRIRWAAVAALGKLGDHRIIDPLVEMVDDEEWLVSNEAVVVLRAKVAEITGTHDLALARILIRMLGLPDPEIVEIAQGGLLNFGRSATPILCEAMGSVKKTIRRHAAQVMGRIGDPECLPPLVAALDDKSHSVRASSATALGEIGDPGALQPLIAQLGDYHDNVRRCLVGALVRFGEQALGPLCVTVDHTKSKLAKCAAIEALGAIGDRRAIPVLIRHLPSSYHLVRSAVISSLATFGEAVVESLLKMLSYNRSDITLLTQEAFSASDVQTRIRAVRALGVLEDHRAVGLLKTLQSSPERKLAAAARGSLERIGISAWGRSGAAIVLGRIGDSRAIDPVMKLLDDDSVTVRSAAVLSLEGLRATEGAERLHQCTLQDSAPEVRRSALRVLHELTPGSPELFDIALENLTDDSPDVRRRAARIVGEYVDERAVEPLLVGLSDDSWAVRMTVESALVTQGKGTVAGLIRALETGSIPAKRRAVSALGRIADSRAAGPVEKLLAEGVDEITDRLAREALIFLRE